MKVSHIHVSNIYCTMKDYMVKYLMNENKKKPIVEIAVCCSIKTILLKCTIYYICNVHVERNLEKI